MRRLASIAFAVFTAFMLSLPAANAAEGHIGIVKTTEGVATIDRQGNVLPASPGVRVLNGDKLVTGADSAMGVTLLDGSQMSLGPDALLEMDELIYEPQNDNLSLVANFVQGTFSHISGGIGRLKPEAVKMRTPVGTIGIRGTKFVVRVP